MPITLNYGSAEEAAEGEKASAFGPPPAPGDYTMRVTQVDIRESEKLGACQFVAIKARVEKNLKGERVTGFAEYGWINIPPGKEEDYAEYTPNRQKFQARTFLTAIGLDLSARGTKTSVSIDPESWKGLEFYGTVNIVEEEYKDKKSGEQKKIKKGKIVEVFTGEKWKERQSEEG